jgi:small subunit ribosomal protein S6
VNIVVPNHEVVIIYDPFLQDADYAAELERLKELIARRGGEVTNVDVWGRRRLAYPISKKLEGYYVVASFTASSIPGKDLAEIQRTLRLNENVLRVMLTRMPEFKKSKAKRSEKPAKVEVETRSAGDAGAAAFGSAE